MSDFTHEWKFDLPWHMVDLKDWFYMVNVGYIEPTIFLHVRILGVRSLWTFSLPVKTLHEVIKRHEILFSPDSDYGFIGCAWEGDTYAYVRAMEDLKRAIDESNILRDEEV